MLKERVFILFTFGSLHLSENCFTNLEDQESGAVDSERLEKLAYFQEKALRFALSFPRVERVVYSTCSVHQRENEDVVRSVLDFASSKGFHLGYPIPQWQQRGLPVLEGAENLLRVEPSEEMDGFFVALFERSPESLLGMESTGHVLSKKFSKNEAELSGKVKGQNCKRKHKSKR